MYCSYCSAYNNDKATYCATCGRELSYSSAESWGDFGEEPLVSSPDPYTPPRKNNRWLWILLGILGVAVIVLALLLFLVRWNPRPEPAPARDTPVVTDSGGSSGTVVVEPTPGSQSSGSIPGPALPRVTPPPGGGNLAAAVPSSAGTHPI